MTTYDLILKFVLSNEYTKLEDVRNYTINGNELVIEGFRIRDKGGKYEYCEEITERYDLLDYITFVYNTK